MSRIPKRILIDSPAFLWAWALVLASGQRASAEPVFLGPLPYRSAADSPFDLSGLGSSFFIEDFEDGALNTPGIAALGLQHFPLEGQVMAPSEATDSVDADDGLIDGSGTDGTSFASAGMIVFTSLPPINQRAIFFELDQSTLGAYPTAFGFVWTDGPADLQILLEVIDADGNQHVEGYSQFLGDPSGDGGTSEDRFFGVVSPSGISRVGIYGNTVGDEVGQTFMEIDHIQYGIAAVPEPAANLTAALLTMICFCARSISATL